MHMTFEDMKVFYDGGELVDTNTLDEKWIHDDCILHAVDESHGGVAVKQSKELTHWRLLPSTKDSISEHPRANPRRG